MINPASLAFDIDGVVADTMRLFLDIAREDHNRGDIRYEDITCYKLEDCINIDTDTIGAIINKLLTEHHISRLKPIDGAPDVLARLGKHYPVIFVTARPDAKIIHKWMQNILSSQGFDGEPEKMPEMEIVATGGSFEAKTEILLDKGISYFVEDRLETCFQLHEAGITPVLFKQPWNRRKHPFVEVGSWKEIESLINF